MGRAIRKDKPDGDGADLTQVYAAAPAEGGHRDIIWAALSSIYGGLNPGPLYFGARAILGHELGAAIWGYRTYSHRPTGGGRVAPLRPAPSKKHVKRDNRRNRHRPAASGAFMGFGEKPIPPPLGGGIFATPPERRAIREV